MSHPATEPDGSEPLDLAAVEDAVRAELDDKYRAREQALQGCRRIIQASANAIRSLHRGEGGAADALIAEAAGIIAEIEGPLEAHPDIYHAGFFYDAVKEYAEAVITAALLAGRDLPLPADVSVSAVPYLKGLGEAVGELRRSLLDHLRSGRLEEAEATFTSMEVIQDLLVGLDYPDGMTGGLRRTTDVARSLIERSRADLTTTIVQERLRADLER